MSTLFKEVDFDTIQLMYGFVLLVLALMLATVLVGNVYALTAVVCALLIKDGLPNFIIGFKNTSAPQKTAAPKES